MQNHNPAYGQIFPTTSTISYNESTEGECIERRVERIMNNNEPITDGAPQIYTDRKDGVLPEYNIRTDRFEVAIEMTDHITKSALAKRKEFHDKLQQQNNPAEPGTPGEPNPPQA